MTQVITIQVPGFQGPMGSLSIGAVTEGPTPAASITGVPPNQVLNLTLPGAGDLEVSTDHGALDGLEDDDHPQYHNDARGDVRYYTKTQSDALGSSSTAGDTIVRRDASGNFTANRIYSNGTPPTGVSELTRKDYVDAGDKLQVSNIQSGTTYTFVLADMNRQVEFGGAAPVTATIPNNTNVAYPVGTVLRILQANATAVTTITGEAGVILGSPDGYSSITGGANAIIYAIKRDTNSWRLTGDLLAATPTAAFHLTRKDYVDSGDRLNAPNVQSGTTYTFVLADATREVDFSNASAITATIPPNSSVAYPIGTVLQIAQFSTGQVTLAAGGGVTLESPSGHTAKTRALRATVYAIKRATDSWLVTGDLEIATPSAVGDYVRKDYADTKVAKAGDAMTGALTVPSQDELRTTGITTNQVINADLATLRLGMSPFADLWHDLLAFHRHAGTPTHETYNGTTWSSATLSNVPFISKEGAVTTVINGTTTTGARWTWNHNALAFSTGRWVVIGFGYEATGPSRTVVIETSTDGTAWTTRHTSTNVLTAQPLWHGLSSYGGDNWFRVTITAAGPVHVSSMKLLTHRWGDQGGGSEYKYPYTWDVNQLVTFVTARSSNGPSNVADLTRKDYVDALGTNVGTGNTIVRRHADGSAEFTYATATTAPSSAQSLTRKDYVDTQVATKANTSHGHTAADVSVTSTRAWTWINPVTLPSASSAPSTWLVGLTLQETSGGIALGYPADTIVVETDYLTPNRGTQYVTEKITGKMWVRTISVTTDVWGSFVEVSRAGHTHVATTDLTATGTKDSTTFLRGDNTWAVPAGGGGGWSAVDASETVKGIAEIATSGETSTGTDDTRIVTPLKLKGITDLKANASITISAGTGLTGGGDLSANRTLTVAYGSASGTAVQGNDARVTADQAAGTASIRTIGTGALQAAAGNHTHTATGISDSTATGRSVLTAADAAAARTAIGAGTSSLALGSTGSTAAAGDHTHSGLTADQAAGTASVRTIGTGALQAAAGNHTHTATGISDSTTVGRAVMTAADAAAARTAIGAGTSSIVVGTGAGDAKAGNYQPTAANISDSTTVGRSILTAADAAAVRTASGAASSAITISPGNGLTGGGDLTANRTLTVAYGSATNTAVQGNDTRVTADQAAGTASIRTLGTGSTQAAAGNHTHTSKDVTNPSVALTDGATIAVDASLGRLFRVTIAGNRTILAPTNAADGMRIMFEVTASGADRTLTMTTGSSGAFAYGTDFTSIPTITSGTTAFIGCIYSSRSSRWHVLAVGVGHP